MEEDTHSIVILWDLLKQRLRPSELNEMSRLLGHDLVDNLKVSPTHADAEGPEK